MTAGPASTTKPFDVATSIANRILVNHLCPVFKHEVREALEGDTQGRVWPLVREVVKNFDSSLQALLIVEVERWSYGHYNLMEELGGGDGRSLLRELATYALIAKIYEDMVEAPTGVFG